jgi:hypothetical protein
MNLKCGRAEIEKLVDKVIKENPDTVRSFRNPKRREFAHCFLGGMVYKFLYILTFKVWLMSFTLSKPILKTIYHLL